MRNILKQTSWLFFAQLLTRLISFFYIIYLAKALAVSDFGLYTVALAYFSIISSIADLGFNRFLIREIARDKLRISELLLNIIIFRLTLTSVLFALFAIFLYIFDQDKTRTSLILLATLAILPQSVAVTFDGIFVALKKLQFSAIALFVSSLFTALIGIFLVSRGFGPIGAVGALIIGQLIFALLLIILLIKSHKVVLTSIQFSTIKNILTGSLPYGILGVLGLFYFKIDAVLLSYLKGSFDTGIYGAAYKALEAAIFIPGTFSVALFPTLARLHEENIGEMKKIYFKSIKIMGLIGVVILLGYILVLPFLIKLFLPNYLQAINAIKILAFSIPFIFMASPGVQVILSSEKYLKTAIWLSFITVGFNVILNLIFIPKYSFIAASWITVFSEILSFIIFFFFVKKKILN